MFQIFNLFFQNLQILTLLKLQFFNIIRFYRRLLIEAYITVYKLH
jgi:hypothetical protein